MFRVRLPSQGQLMDYFALSQLQFTNQPLFPLGTTVYHDGHGRGVVTAYNNHPSPWYGRSKYPYFVRFDSGYQDVYSPKELTR